MSSTAAVVSIVISVILGNFLCAEVNNRNTLQNPWQRVNSTSYDYNTQIKTTPWPALGSRRNQQNYVQSSTNAPQWIRLNNGQNWVRNTPQPQNSNTGFQDHNTQFLNNENLNSGNRNNGFNPWSTKIQSANYPRPNNVQYNQRALNRNGGVNNIISSGSAITNTQSINNKNEGTGTGEVDDNELRQFSEDLLSKDTNNAAQYVSVNLQGMTTSRSNTDQAPLPLLTINKAAYSIPSISKVIKLHDNYIVEANKNEVYTTQEKSEETDLLNTIIQTPAMEYTKNFLINKGKLGTQEFIDLLQTIWFNMYSRQGGKVGSSGFEHVFLAELKNNQVSGFHNWIYFNAEEQKNNANYLGYMKNIDLGGKGSILKFHFTFHGVDKPVGAMFIGTSPELEMALYTACFVLRADRICPLKMNGKRFIIRTYTYKYRGKNMIGSAFPEI